ncbi:MAG: tyrosine-type recombinase/integrase [Candidatus Acidiferrales bacterium]
MLTIFRRHKKECPHRSEGRDYRRCHCSIAVEGLLGDGYIRASLKTADWNRAQDIAREWESEQRITGRQAPASIEQVTESYLADAHARNLAAETIKKYRALFARLNEWARASGYELLRDVDVDALSRFRGTWKDGPRAGQKKLERLRAFFRFAQKRRWIADNPASELKAPKIPPSPTLPFTQDEMLKILTATEAYREHAQSHAKLNAIRLRSLILILRYSGLRLGDAVSLSPDRLSADDKLFVRTAKTGVPVKVKLPAYVAEALRKTPMMDGRYWFRTTEAKLRTAVSRWQNRLSALSKSQGIAIRAHRFRDTFAVELLLAGVPMERVSVLLGHESLRTTERHYAPWVRARQEQLERDVAQSWCNDHFLQMQTNHTRDTRGERERPN